MTLNAHISFHFIFIQRVEDNVNNRSWARGIVAYTFNTSTSTPTAKQFGAYDLNYHYTEIIEQIESKTLTRCWFKRFQVNYYIYYTCLTCIGRRSNRVYSGAP